ncbi:MAG TPA: DUF308 domain-containing protein [Candidatus Saccharimonadales bacterium]|nr:DUF308 domain-containing protein [Candidatus Saccharimonadales bacterium]
MSAVSVTRDNWWALVLGGVATLLFGLASVFWPGLNLHILLYLFSAFVLIVGVVDALTGLGSIGVSDTWFLPSALGAFELGVGIYMLRHTHVKFTTFVALIGFTLIARAVVEAVNAYFSVATLVKAQALSYLSALVALVAGIIILFSKQSHGVSFVWLLGTYAIVTGIFQISGLSIRPVK